MTRKRIHAEQRDVERQNQRADADPKPVRPHAAVNHVGRENYQKDERQIQEIPMQVLEQEQSSLASVGVASGLAHRAGRWIQKVSPVVSFAVIVTGHAEPTGGPQYEQ